MKSPQSNRHCLSTDYCPSTKASHRARANAHGASRCYEDADGARLVTPLKGLLLLVFLVFGSLSSPGVSFLLPMSWRLLTSLHTSASDSLRLLEPKATTWIDLNSSGPWTTSSPPRTTSPPPDYRYPPHYRGHSPRLQAPTEKYKHRKTKCFLTSSDLYLSKHVSSIILAESNSTNRPPDL